MVGWGCLASAQLACASPLPGEQRRVSEALLATCSPATRRTSPAPAVLPFACLPTEQSRRERPPASSAGSASTRLPGMGELGDLGLSQHLPSSTWPTGLWNLPWGAVTTQVVPLGQSGSLGIRPQGLKAGRRVVDTHVGPVPWLTRGTGAVGCQVVDAPCSGPTHWDTPEPSPRAGSRVAVSSSGCLRQSPASRPLHLPTEPDAALWKIPSGVCCLSPPSRHPQWRRCVRINGKSLHKYLEKKKGKSKKNKRTAPKLPAFLMIAASRWGTQVLNVHPSAAQSQQAARAMPLRSGQYPGAPELPPRGWEEDDPALAFDGSQGVCAGAGLPFIHNA